MEQPNATMHMKWLCMNQIPIYDITPDAHCYSNKKNTEIKSAPPN